MSMVPHRTKQITFDLVIAAGTLVKLAHKHDTSLHRAVERAAPRLMEMPWRVNEGVLEVVSYSHPSDTQKTDGEWCSCQCVRGVCWHKGAWTLLSTIAATGVEVEATLPLPNMVEVDQWAGLESTVLNPEPGTPYARVTALVDELF